MNKRVGRILEIPKTRVEKELPELGQDDIEALPTGEEVMRGRKEDEARRMQNVALERNPEILQKQAESAALLLGARERAHELLTKQEGSPVEAKQVPPVKKTLARTIMAWFGGEKE